jgi:hypothetical protein
MNLCFSSFGLKQCFEKGLSLSCARQGSLPEKDGTPDHENKNDGGGCGRFRVFFQMNGFGGGLRME